MKVDCERTNSISKLNKYLKVSRHQISNIIARKEEIKRKWANGGRSQSRRVNVSLAKFMAKCLNGSAWFSLQETSIKRSIAERDGSNVRKGVGAQQFISVLPPDMTFHEFVALDDGREVTRDNDAYVNEAEH